MAAPVIIAERCHYCSRQRALSEIMDWPGGARICVGCIHHHEAALHALSTSTPPKECSECNEPWAELAARQAVSTNGLKMIVHFENGVYRLMCVDCDAIYVKKRRDLYGETEFGRNL